MINNFGLPPLHTAEDNKPTVDENMLYYAQDIKPIYEHNSKSIYELPPMQSPPPPTRSRLPTYHAERGRTYLHRRSNSPSSSRSASPPSPRLPQHGSRARSPRTERNVLDEPLPPHISDLIARIQPTPRTGPWDEAEDQVLLYFVDGGRNKNWVRIAARMHFRTAKQCRERYFQSLRPGISHAACTPEEAELIMRLVDQIGTRWADIARRLGNRSDNWVKNWWNGQRNERTKNRSSTLSNASSSTSTTTTSSSSIPGTTIKASPKEGVAPAVLPPSAQPPQHYNHHYGESVWTEGLFPHPSSVYWASDRRPSFVPSCASERSPHQSSRMSEASSPASLDCWSSAASASSLSLATTPVGSSPRPTGAATHTRPSFQHYSLPPVGDPHLHAWEEQRRSKAAAAAAAAAERYQPTVMREKREGEKREGTRMSLSAVLN